jgi:hypothetical protein
VTAKTISKCQNSEQLCKEVQTLQSPLVWIYIWFRAIHGGRMQGDERAGRESRTKGTARPGRMSPLDLRPREQR